MEKLKQYLQTHPTGPLARSTGVSLQAVRLWKAGRCHPSPAMALRIEAATCGEVSRSDLYPDLWPVA
ncbi:MAG: YdaS family helix-turn-helix protein [Acidobacteriaceae bacterium]